jgi:hypothetical protein
VVNLDEVGEDFFEFRQLIDEFGRDAMWRATGPALR